MKRRKIATYSSVEIDILAQRVDKMKGLWNDHTDYSQDQDMWDEINHWRDTMQFLTLSEWKGFLTLSENLHSTGRLPLAHVLAHYESAEKFIDMIEGMPQDVAGLRYTVEQRIDSIYQSLELVREDHY